MTAFRGCLVRPAINPEALQHQDIETRIVSSFEMQTRQV